MISTSYSQPLRPFYFTKLHCWHATQKRPSAQFRTNLRRIAYFGRAQLASAFDVRVTRRQASWQMLQASRILIRKMPDNNCATHVELSVAPLLPFPSQGFGALCTCPYCCFGHYRTAQLDARIFFRRLVVSRGLLLEQLIFISPHLPSLGKLWLRTRPCCQFLLG